MTWVLFDDGTTVGQTGSENGTIVRDDEHELGARITMERNGDIAPFSITCGIYGWMLHTRFFSTEVEASAEFNRMKEKLAVILYSIPAVDDAEVDSKTSKVSDAISDFVERFP